MFARLTALWQPIDGVVAKWPGAIRRYWFRTGGELSLGICRIAIFASMMHTLLLNYRDAAAVSAHLATASPENYLPKGILKLFGTLPLSADLMTIVWWVAYIATAMAIAGFVTRPAMIVSTLCTLALISLKESFGPLWSHGYNVVMCAGLAIMFGAAGASLSLDRILHVWLRWPFGRAPAPDGYYWPVLAAQIAVALFYFAAFWAKLYHGGLYWAFSDNMRIMLAITWEHPYYAVPIPAYIQWMMDHKLLWQLAAVAHLLSQALPLFAAFLIHRPLARLAEGAIFAGGIYGLYLVMDVWNPQWFWLVAVFVDWEWVFGLLRRLGGFTRSSAPAWLVPRSFVPGTHGGAPPPEVTSAHRSKAPRIATLSYLGIFLGYYVVVFAFQLGERHLNYPFSSFDFYAVNYAYPPYNQHRHYTFMAGGIVFEVGDCRNMRSDGAVAASTFVCLDGTAEFNRRIKQNSTIFGYYSANTHERVTGALKAIRAYADQRYPGFIPADARVSLSTRLWQYPPYPEPVAPRVSLDVLRGVLLPDGTSLSAIGTERIRDGERLVEISLQGFKNPQVTMLYRHDPWYRHGTFAPEPLPGAWIEEKKSFRVDAKALKRPAFSSIQVRDGERTYEFWGPILY